MNFKMPSDSKGLFLSVFWDLYCAAPERRDTCDHSSEAKAFHDYVSYTQDIKYSPPHHTNSSSCILTEAPLFSNAAQKGFVNSGYSVNGLPPVSKVNQTTYSLK